MLAAIPAEHVEACRVAGYYVRPAPLTPEIRRASEAAFAAACERWHVRPADVPPVTISPADRP